MELLQKGISAEIVARALEEAEEQMDAKETIRKMLQSKRKGEGAMEEKEKQRLYGFFMRKGFSSSEILSVSLFMALI